MTPAIDTKRFLKLKGRKCLESVSEVISDKRLQMIDKHIAVVELENLWFVCVADVATSPTGYRRTRVSSLPSVKTPTAEGAGGVGNGEWLGIESAG